MENNAKSLKYYLLFILAGLGVYFNSFWVNFIWDDRALILENYLIRNPANAFKLFSNNLSAHGDIFYRPLQSISNLIDFLIFKFDYRGYHLTNIILHIIVAALLFRLLILFTNNLKLSFFSSFLFLVCPLWVESVTYISGRADVLMAIFILSSFINFARGRVILSLILFIFALLSKEMSLIYPFVLILYVFLYRDICKKLWFVIPYFFLADILYYLVRIKIGIGYVFFGSLKVTFLTRVLFLFEAIIRYIGLIFLPLNQHMSYSVNLPQSLFDLRVLFSLGVFSAGVFIYIYYLKKEKLVSFFIGWFIIFLLPQSGLFPINAYFSEHFIYLSAMGIFVIFVYFLLKIKQRRITNLIFLIYAVFFSAATIKYNFVWQDEIEFYKRIIKLTKNSFTACNNLGVIYLDRKDYIKAEKLFIKSLEANPDFFEAKLNLARFYYFKNDYKRAIGLAEAVIKDNPNSYLGYNYLGVFYSKVGNFELAEDYFEKATEINPKYMGLWYDLHSFYKDRGNDQKANAVRDYIAKTDKFSLAELYYREAKTFSGANNFDEALAEVDNAIKIDLRNSDYFNLRGSILRKIGRYPQAYNDFKMAINISLRNYEAYNNLGNLFALAKDFKNAESNFRRAIKLNADFTDAYFNLGLLYLENNKTKEAAECFKKAIVLNSDHNLAKEYLKRIENPAK